MKYSPAQGDIVYLQFDPQAGHEQKGKRPALVASNNLFNKFTNLAIVCPITSTNRGFPLHVKLDSNTKTTGIIMCEQAKALDLQARNVVFIEKVSEYIIAEVVDILMGFVEM